MTERSKLGAFVLSVLLFIILSLVAEQPEETISSVLKTIAYLSLPVLGGFVILSLSSVVSAISIRGSSATLELIRQVSAAPKRNFILGFFASAYLILIRPRLAASITFLLYCEWLVIVSSVYLVYSVTGFSFNETDDRSEILGWRKHVQEVTRETGPDFKQIAAVVDQFVSEGIKEPLLVYLALYLQRLGSTDREILDILDPLVCYREDAKGGKVRSLISPGARAKHVMADKKTRENLVEVLFEKIYRLRPE